MAEGRGRSIVRLLLEAQIDKIKRAKATARFDKVFDLDDLRQRDENAFTERIDRINALAKK